MSKHTPGPWHSEQAYNELGTYISGPNTELIAKILDGDGCSKENARLIVAAPDMLEALRRVVAVSGEITGGVWAEIHAAIARAEGKSHA